MCSPNYTLRCEVPPLPSANTQARQQSSEDRQPQARLFVDSAPVICGIVLVSLLSRKGRNGPETVPECGQNGDLARCKALMLAGMDGLVSCRLREPLEVSDYFST
jgi:hypothetical protein